MQPPDAHAPIDADDPAITQLGGTCAAAYQRLEASRGCGRGVARR